jgi:hypothetical protein
MTISMNSAGFVVRANDQKTFLQTTVSFSNAGVIRWTFVTAKPFIDIKYLEISPNYNGKLSGICGNMDGLILSFMITGNPHNDLKGPNDNLVAPEENLFHSCGLSSRLQMA